MRYKGFILDIDNTLYDYNSNHEKAFELLILETQKETNKNKDIVIEAYIQARKEIHIELSETASSHNRLLYIQRTLELLHINSMNLSLKLYNTYWDTFLNHMKPFDNAIEFLNQYKDKSICLLTDLTAHIQHRKIEKLGLYKYADYIVTSEEAGKEKPHPYMFMLALKKMNLKSSEVCMIGDSYKKDIVGASQLGIQSFWLNREEIKENTNSDLIVEFQNFKELEERMSYE